MIDAREFIKTSKIATDSSVNWEETKIKINSFLSKDKSYITQGFIGSNLDGETTTLGREGSDFSAAIFAWAMDAQELYLERCRWVIECRPKMV